VFLLLIVRVCAPEVEGERDREAGEAVCVRRCAPGAVFGAKGGPGTVGGGGGGVSEFMRTDTPSSGRVRASSSTCLSRRGGGWGGREGGRVEEGTTGITVIVEGLREEDAEGGVGRIGGAINADLPIGNSVTDMRGGRGGGGGYLHSNPGQTAKRLSMTLLCQLDKLTPVKFTHDDLTTDMLTPDKFTPPKTQAVSHELLGLGKVGGVDERDGRGLGGLEWGGEEVGREMQGLCVTNSSSVWSPGVCVCVCVCVCVGLYLHL
jgi:hypothetical protein